MQLRTKLVQTIELDPDVDDIVTLYHEIDRLIDSPGASNTLRELAFNLEKMVRRIDNFKEMEGN